MWLVDLHCHTAMRSADSAASLATVLSDAAARGVQSLCLTEHDAFWGAGELAPALDTGTVAIPGAEINTDSGHVLVFGLAEYRFGFHHVRNLAEAVGRAGGATVLAHPYRRVLPPGVTPNTAGYDSALARALDNPLLRLVDAIEVMNGRGTVAENRLAHDISRSTGLPGVAGSDAHQAGEAGRVATAFDTPTRSVADLIAGLKSGGFHVAHGPAASAPARQTSSEQL